MPDFNNEQKIASVILKKGEGRTIKSGGLWVYDNEIDHIIPAETILNSTSGRPSPKQVWESHATGEIVQVLDFDGYFMGYGFINTLSKITVRLLSRRKEHPVNEALIEKRVRDAWEYRKAVMRSFSQTDADSARMLPADVSSCRIVFGEADFLPGITIDKFSDVLVVESLALGIDLLKPLILETLVRVLAEDGIAIRGIYERSDAKVRLQEGLPRTKGFIGEPFDTKVEIIENGVRYLVDVKDGQKTGFFLDQKYNRAAVARLCPGKKVLDCFTHTGSFGLNAAKAGASSVLAVDASETGISQAKENAALNGLTDEQIRFETADVFELLPQLERSGETFDVVILDPPAFTKSRETIKKAVKGYREINLRGMKLVKDGGYLATCSCSHFMESECFARTIAEAARSAHKRLRQVEFRTQGPDHPILWAADTSYYLKFYIFQVVEER